jgi:T3SS negative regulator,GrlR
VPLSILEKLQWGGTELVDSFHASSVSVAACVVFKIMQDGIYSVVVSSHGEPHGEAILVLRDGIFNGGGPGYLCSGHCDEENGTITFEAWPYREDRATIFGDKDRYHLSLKRDTLKSKLVFSGFVENPSRPITAEFIWRSPARAK